jgi:ABC-2 type transport system permease protein
LNEALPQVWAIARKEIRAYFGSPLALIFLGVFLAVSLFIFFWVESFFARNIADLRPLFRWMPILMIFLVATLTMRQWSEEARSGTMEVLLTLPVHRANLVLGKFVAVMVLIGVAVLLTLSLPVTVSLLGDLDLGPAFGGYLATILMASVYVSIGLFFSSRTDNQIVSLILTVLFGGALYLIGTNGVTSLGGDDVAEILRSVGVGSRFESIERGVIDLRDLVYYISLTVLFLLLNVVSLDLRRLGKGAQARTYRRNAAIGLLLVLANLAVLNLWLYPIPGLRADLTANNEFSLSDTTKDLVSGLPEPLLLRGYFSERTHPLLARLVPSVRDLMREYGVASEGGVNVEFVDPREDEELEEEANRAYGIRSTSFAITERRESTVINSYFDILIRYGDQFVTLGFGDLIEIEPRPDGSPDVRLRNLEHDLTGAIKRVVSGFRSLDAVFSSLSEPMTLTSYVTVDALPEEIQGTPKVIDLVALEFVSRSGGQLEYDRIDPDAPDSTVSRQTMLTTFGLSPLSASAFSPDTYYLNMILEYKGESYLITPSGQMEVPDLRADILAALRQAVPGFLKTVALWLPAAENTVDAFGNPVAPISSFGRVQNTLAQSYVVEAADLSGGRVLGNVDVLVVLAPRLMSDVERYAVDQFLMRGGAVIVASGNFIISPIQFQAGLSLEPIQDGLNDLLASYGVTIGNSLVMDPQNEPFPMQVRRDLGGFSVLEMQSVDYPLFVDVRRDGMETDSPILSNLQSVTLQWASPLEIDAIANQDREVERLLRSTEDAWLRSSFQVLPDQEAYPDLGFPVEGERSEQLLAASIKGSFKSYFAGRPLESVGADGLPIELPALIENSPDSARLVVFGSSEFVDDLVLELSRSLSADRFLFNLQLLQNAVDWAAEDLDLLALSSGGIYTRLLQPLDEREQTFWEAANYGAALAVLVVIGLVWNLRRRGERPMKLVDEGEDA